MNTYCISYRETYADLYEIEADSPEEAKEKFLEKMRQGDYDGPDTCVGADAEIVFD